MSVDLCELEGDSKFCRIDQNKEFIGDKPSNNRRTWWNSGPINDRKQHIDEYSLIMLRYFISWQTKVWNPVS